MLRTGATVHPPQLRALTLDTRSTTSEGARRAGKGIPPVLARLPDVSGPQLQSAQADREVAAGFVRYRFDPPQAGMRTSRPSIGDAAGRAALPHHLGRSRGDTAPVESSILPRSNPFAIPAASLNDSLGAWARFLVLFALFTAIGTTVLTMSRTVEPVEELVEPATAAMRPSLEPQPNSAAVKVPASGPTAVGPVGKRAARTGLRAKEQPSPTREAPQSAVAHGPSDFRTARTDRQVVPQMRTTEPENRAGDDAAGPPAMARLSGTILAAPTQQAHHDDDQSSLY
jgi:hypothetical protein